MNTQQTMNAQETIDALYELMPISSQANIVPSDTDINIGNAADTPIVNALLTSVAPPVKLKTKKLQHRMLH